MMLLSVTLVLASCMAVEVPTREPTSALPGVETRPFEKEWFDYFNKSEAISASGLLADRQLALPAPLTAGENQRLASDGQQSPAKPASNIIEKWMNWTKPALPTSDNRALYTSEKSELTCEDNGSGYSCVNKHTAVTPNPPQKAFQDYWKAPAKAPQSTWSNWTDTTMVCDEFGKCDHQTESHNPKASSTFEKAWGKELAPQSPLAPVGDNTPSVGQAGTWSDWTDTTLVCDESGKCDYRTECLNPNAPAAPTNWWQKEHWTPEALNAFSYAGICVLGGVAVIGLYWLVKKLSSKK